MTTKTHRIATKYLPLRTNFPIVAIWYLLLDRWHAPHWLMWEVVCALAALNLLTLYLSCTRVTEVHPSKLPER